MSSLKKVNPNACQPDGIFRTMPLIDHSKLIKTIDSDDGPEQDVAYPNDRLMTLEKKFQNSKLKHREILVKMSKKIEHL